MRMAEVRAYAYGSDQSKKGARAEQYSTYATRADAGRVGWQATGDHFPRLPCILTKKVRETLRPEIAGRSFAELGRTEKK